MNKINLQTKLKTLDESNRGVKSETVMDLSNIWIVWLEYNGQKRSVFHRKNITDYCTTKSNP